MRIRRFGEIMVVVTFVTLLCGGDAYAYIDPGTGSMILQALLAMAVAAIAFGKHIWYFFVGVFRKNKVDESLKIDTEME